ncbi:MAG: hypothetical protein KDD84_04305, partial [Caldilineaceae bacterium]|nr:hypothetical protein [Caldilineaceae bacterium]
MSWRFARFLFPLVVTIIVQEFGVQYINAGMARMPQATETLAAFALAWGLILFLAGPMAQAKQLGLVLVDSRANYRRNGLFVLVASLILMAVQVSLVLTPLGHWVIDDLHRVDGTLSAWVRLILLWMAPIPLFRSATLFYQGILIRARRTEVISYATTAGIACGIGAVSVLLTIDVVRANPVWLPILATYAMTVVEFAVVYVGFRRNVDLPSQPEETGDMAAPFSASYILRFYWPLALINFVQELSRPLINLFIARGPDATVALAVLSIAYALGQWPYRWLNEIRNLPPAFHREDPGLRVIRRFALVCGVLSFAMSAGLFWTPLRDVILGRLMGVEAELAQLARWPLALYAFFAFVVTIRAYLHGISLLEHRTRALAPSAPARVLA